MYKTFIAGLSLGLLLLNPTALHAKNSFDEIPLPLISPRDTPLSDSVSKSVAELKLSTTHSIFDNMSKAERGEADLKLSSIHSKLGTMNKAEREKLAKRLGSLKRTELQRAIPENHQDAAATKDSFCCMFWKGCFRVSSKTLGNLAIDLVLDLSDGKLDAIGPNGEIDYIHHIVDLIDATMKELQVDKK